MVQCVGKMIQVSNQLSQRGASKIFNFFLKVAYNVSLLFIKMAKHAFAGHGNECHLPATVGDLMY